MTQEQMILALVESTIRTVSNHGLDKTTTKLIANGANLNEVYIYRLFEGKEDLLKKTFDRMDEELVLKCKEYFPLFAKDEIDFETKNKMVFSALWKFLLSGKDKCLFFIRYYHSPYFKKFSSDEHYKRYKPIIDLMSNHFNNGVDAGLMLNHILTITLHYVLLVFDGRLEDNVETADLVFTLTYSSIKPFMSK